VVLDYNDDFEVTWRDPEDGGLSWSYDAVHFPTPFPLLSQDIASLAFGEFGTRIAWVNGYPFRVFRLRPPAPELAERGFADVWFNDYLHRLRTVSESLAGADYESLPAEELAANLETYISQYGQAWYYTLDIFPGHGQTHARIDRVLRTRAG
jgi:hypothetical protein